MHATVAVEHSCFISMVHACAMAIVRAYNRNSTCSSTATLHACIIAIVHVVVQLQHMHVLYL